MIETTEKKPESKFPLISVKREIKEMMDAFNNTHGKRMGYGDVIVYLLFTNSKRIREDICRKWIDTGDKQAGEELVEEIRGYKPF